MRNNLGHILYSPSDLISYTKSPFASWMDHYFLENPLKIKPDVQTEDQKLIAETGNKHELMVLEELKLKEKGLVEISKETFPIAVEKTKEAINFKAPIIYQAALERGQFAGYADFLILAPSGQYHVWDTKLASSPKPYYAIQLCCYSELLAAITKESLPKKFGIILGTKDPVEFLIEDFIHYYNQTKENFLKLHNSFTGNIKDCPDPLPNGDHGRWTSYAEKFFKDRDHLVKVAGITVGQIKKLNAAGIESMSQLATTTVPLIKNLATDSFENLVAQARLQNETRKDRENNPDVAPRYEILSQLGDNNESVGLSTLPPANVADVFFDMEGYPLVPGGLEYLFGAICFNCQTGSTDFYDWWSHDRDSEKIAFEGFMKWVYNKWKANPEMHVYHYASYEINALKRLSTRHDICQDEIDNLLRANVFIDLYKVVRHGIRIGEDSYSIKSVERLYRPKRVTEVTSAVDSIVQYASWVESKQSTNWKESTILRAIRDYNEDDCKSTSDLLIWLRQVALDYNISYSPANTIQVTSELENKLQSPNIVERLETIHRLRQQQDFVSHTLADLIDFHRREEKPMWWRMYDRKDATSEELRDDSGCIQGINAVGNPLLEKQSLVQSYIFDPSQECKLNADGKTTVMFSHNINGKFTLTALDMNLGLLKLKISKSKLNEIFGGTFPSLGSLIQYEHVPSKVIQQALTEIGIKHLSSNLPESILAILERRKPNGIGEVESGTTIDSTVRITKSMAGSCLPIQGPPGTGKTYTAANVIISLLISGKKVGIASNSHKAIVNVLLSCGESAKKNGTTLKGVKVGGDSSGELFLNNPELKHVENNKDAFREYDGGIVGGTAWLFTNPDWNGVLDFLFIDEAGQVSLANAVAMARCANNIVLIGDQMQLEQPTQGTHPGDAALSSLQFCLKDVNLSKPDFPVFHSVVPSDHGIFLGESRRMHPMICSFISDSVYEGRLSSFIDCAKQKVEIKSTPQKVIRKENGIVFIGIEHDGNIQQSNEEVNQVKKVYDDLLGCLFTSSEGTIRKLELNDFLFISPYNAQVRALQTILPPNARVGSVDKFQGQQAPICILSLCSSYGEYGSRGLSFILDRNRINVGISRAQCLAIVVADPRIANASANSIKEMMLLNLFCKIVRQGLN